ncbi:MAG: conjugal transfer protein TrbE, partial [Deltaproteobacteria bacterium]|nr:conjugal transfer protein TrbE [Deltaproteobacteria bacterium]
MLSLKSFRKGVKGLADLLKYAALLSESVILNKDGSLTAMYRYRGSDTASISPAEQNRIAFQVNQAMMLFGDGWLLHVDAIRTEENYYPDNNHFPDGVSRLMDEERREWFNGAERASCYKTEQYLSLTWLPAYTAEKILAAAGGGKQDQGLERILASFESSLKAFEDIMSSVVALRRLGARAERELDEYGREREVVYSDLLSVLHYVITGILQPVRLPACPMYLDALLATQDLVGGAAPRIGDKRIAAVSLDGLPQESCPAMLAALEGLPFEFRFSTRFLFLDKLTADTELENYYKSWNQKVYKFLDKVFPSPNPKANDAARDMTEDAREARTELESDFVGFGYLSVTLIILHEDEAALEECARSVRKTAQGLGFGCRIEDSNTLEAWLGSHPGNSYANLRRPLISTANLSHMLPLATIWHGRPINPCPFYPPESPCLAVLVTTGNTPFYFSPHVGDLGHTSILGATGSGKSAFLGLMAAQFRRYPFSRLYCFDKGNSMEILCRAVGGRHFDIGGSASGPSFAPLRHIASAAEFAWAADWVESLINMRLSKKETTAITPKQKNLLTDCLRDLTSQPEEQRSLLHLYYLLHSKDQEMSASLRHYTREGAMGTLLDAAEDGLTLSDFTVFEIEALMNQGEGNLIPVLLYMFHRIETSLKGQPTMLILDEAWVMFKHPLFAAKIREWLKVMRKANCMVWLATQQISDAGSNLEDVLIESCPNKFYLPNAEAISNQTVRDRYIRFGLSEREIELISLSTPKKHYYLRSTEGSRLLDLRLGAKTLAFIGRSDKESVARVRELERANPEGWQMEWLKMNGAG